MHDNMSQIIIHKLFYLTDVPGGYMSITIFAQFIWLFPIRLSPNWFLFTVTTTLPFLLEAGCLCLIICINKQRKIPQLDLVMYWENTVQRQSSSIFFEVWIALLGIISFIELIHCRKEGVYLILVLPNNILKV